MRELETLLVDYTDGVALITLNRPEKLNSFNQKMHDELRGIIAELATDPQLRGVILTGAGRGFCAGQDLSERAPLPEGQVRDMGESLEQNYNPLIMSIRALAVPVVCFVNGVAAGSGVSLALACDIVIATETASFIQAFAKLGLAPDAGCSYFLPRIIGTQRALAVSMFAKPITAIQAEQWGLVWQVITHEQLSTEIELMCQTLRTGPTKSYEAIKKLMYSGKDSLDEQLRLEVETQRHLGYTDDYREGSRAFKEKRPPLFKGC